VKTHKQKVDVTDLEIGMYVSELDRDWLDSPFLIQGFLLKDDEQIEEIRNLCKYVYVDILQSRVAVKEKPAAISTGARAKAHKLSFDKQTPPPEVPFQQEIQVAKQIHTRLKSVIDGLYQSAAHDKKLNIDQVRTIVEEVVNSINRNEYALGWMTQLKNKDEYTAIHSMNVCILSVELGRHVGLGQDELNLLGMCGLMHDIGKIRVPNEILNKPGDLTEAELKIMKTHADIGASLLENTPGTPREVFNTAFSHHERLDGGGYPRRIPGEEIDAFTRIVMVADMYDAITSDRVYRPGAPSSKAMSVLYEKSGTQLDPDLVQAFIQCIGVYPVGTLVEVDTGEVGIVITIDARHRMNPSLLVVLDKIKQRLNPPRILNTAKAKGERGGFKYNIKRALNVGSFGIHPKDFFVG